MTTVMTTSPMTTDEIFDIARREIDSLDKRYQIYPLVRVNSRMTRYAGRSFYDVSSPYHLIELCRHFHQADREQLVETVRHEYAHLLAFSRHGVAAVDDEDTHGPLWQAAAVECGADHTQATAELSLFSAGYRSAVEKPYRFFECPSCDNFIESRRRPARNLECRQCGQSCEFFIEVTPDEESAIAA